MNVNEKFSVQITGMTAEGEGVARIEGEAVFIPGAIAPPMKSPSALTQQKVVAVPKSITIRWPLYLV